MRFRRDNFKRCDSCNRGVWKNLTSKVSRWCASWFIGEYCKHCYIATENAMRKIVTEESQRETLNNDSR